MKLHHLMLTICSLELLTACTPKVECIQHKTKHFKAELINGKDIRYNEGVTLENANLGNWKKCNDVR